VSPELVDALRRIEGVDPAARAAWLRKLQPRPTDADRERQRELDEDRRKFDRMLAEESGAAVVKAIEKLGRQIEKHAQERKPQRKRKAQKQALLPAGRKMRLVVETADDLRRKRRAWVTNEDLLRLIVARLNDRADGHKVTVDVSTVKRARAWSKRERDRDL
jgi:hypothetical protein